MLIYRHKQFITLFAALVIVLAQYGALVHATDHPFHQEDVLCISLQSVAQDTHFFHAASYSLFNVIFINDVASFFVESVSPSFYSSYSSRAPPAIAT